VEKSKDKSAKITKVSPFISVRPFKEVLEKSKFFKGKKDSKREKSKKKHCMPKHQLPKLAKS